MASLGKTDLVNCCKFGGLVQFRRIKNLFCNLSDYMYKGDGHLVLLCTSIIDAFSCILCKRHSLIISQNYLKLLTITINKRGEKDLVRGAIVRREPSKDDTQVHCTRYQLEQQWSRHLYKRFQV